jgi:hypothetical protein
MATTAFLLNKDIVIPSPGSTTSHFNSEQIDIGGGRIDFRKREEWFIDHQHQNADNDKARACSRARRHAQWLQRSCCSKKVFASKAYAEATSPPRIDRATRAETISLMIISFFDQHLYGVCGARSVRAQLCAGIPAVSFGLSRWTAVSTLSLWIAAPSKRAAADLRSKARLLIRARQSRFARAPYDLVDLAAARIAKATRTSSTKRANGSSVATIGIESIDEISARSGTPTITLNNEQGSSNGLHNPALKLQELGSAKIWFVGLDQSRRATRSCLTAPTASS